MKNSTIVWRFLIALFVGVVVAAISIRSVWLQARGAPLLIGERWSTHGHMETIGRAIEEYQNKHGKLPASLEELQDVWTALSDQTDGFRDGWGQPLIYSATDSGYSLLSLGRDGRPGGIGPDWDMSSADPNRDPFYRMPTSPEALPTLAQFLFELRTGSMVGTCLFGGLLAALLTFYLVRSPRISIGVVAGVIFTVIAAAAVSGAMATLHIPTGH